MPDNPEPNAPHDSTAQLAEDPYGRRPSTPDEFRYATAYTEREAEPDEYGYADPY